MISYMMPKYLSDSRYDLMISFNIDIYQLVPPLWITIMNTGSIMHCGVCYNKINLSKSFDSIFSGLLHS